MKKLLLIAVIFGALAGFAIAGDLTFTNVSTITNTSAKDYSALYTGWACEITNRVGTSDIVVTIQGSILTESSAFANITTNRTISNATTTTTNPSSLQFQETDIAARRIRLHIVNGTDIGNTISGVCKAVR